MRELKIDPEFESLIQPLTDEEFKQLHDNIMEDGEVLNPIITWNGIIVDGHNRWKIIQEDPDISYKTREMVFLTRESVKEWICKNQLGRRNLTAEQRLRLIGQMQTMRKQARGNHAERDETGKYLKGQNEPLGKNLKTTAEAIAREVGVSEATVKRAEKYSAGIDTLSEASQEAANKVLRGGSGVTRATIMELPKMEPAKREEVVRGILHPEPKPEKPSPTAYTIENLISEINNSADNYIRFLRQTLVSRSTVYAEQAERNRVFEAITEIKSRLSEIEDIIK